MKWMRLLICIGVLCGILSGCCLHKEQETEPEIDLSYEVCDEGRLPKELAEIIERKKEQPFRLTFQTPDYTYIVVGYGVQQRGGCKAVVERLYQQSEQVLIDTNLVGDRGSDIRLDEVTYPYIAIRISKMDLSVVYQ